MKRGILIALVCIAGCGMLTVQDVIDGLFAATRVVDTTRLAVELVSMNQDLNDAAFTEIELTYGIDLKTPTDAFTDAAKELIQTAKELKAAMEAGRGLSEEEQAVLSDLEGLLSLMHEESPDD